MQIDDKVNIHSTDMLSTTFNGSTGTIISLNLLGVGGFHVVFCDKIGDTAVFHESQLSTFVPISIFVIASLKAPREGHEQMMLDGIRAGAEEHYGGIEVVGIKGEHGPGCYNFGVAVEGIEDVAECFIRDLTMILSPSRYSGCGDKIVGVFHLEC